MGRIIKRGTKAKPRFYLKFVDADGVDRTRAAKGAFTIAQARVMLAAIERSVMHGKVGIVEPTVEQREQRSITVRELGEKFTTEYGSPKLKNPANYRAEARGILQARVYDVLDFGDKLAAAVRPVDVERLRDHLLGDDQRYAASSVMIAMATLSKMYTWARKQGYIECDNPVRGCERPRPQRSLDYLSKLEVARLIETADTLASASPSFTYEARVRAPMIATAIYAGLRKGELFGLRWVDVHLDASRLDVQRSYDTSPKSGKARHLPLHPELVRILKQWKEQCPETREGLVFPVQTAGAFVMGDDWQMLGLAETMKAAGCHVPQKPWHSLRHTFASHFMMAGGNILTLQKLLGHASLDMTLIYAHLAPDFMATEVARMSFPREQADVIDLNAARSAAG